MKKFAEIGSNNIVRTFHEGPDNWAPTFSQESGLYAVDVTTGYDPVPQAGDFYSQENDAFTTPTPPAPPALTQEQKEAYFQMTRESKLEKYDYVSKICAEIAAAGGTIGSALQAKIDYRNALRDLTDQPGFTVDDYQDGSANWPVEPA